VPTAQPRLSRPRCLPELASLVRRKESRDVHYLPECPLRPLSAAVVGDGRLQPVGSQQLAPVHQPSRKDRHHDGHHDHRSLCPLPPDLIGHHRLRPALAVAALSRKELCHDCDRHHRPLYALRAGLPRHCRLRHQLAVTAAARERSTTRPIRLTPAVTGMSGYLHPLENERSLAVTTLRLTARYARYLLVSLTTVAFIRPIPNN
jgi:hypothetical protein